MSKLGDALFTTTQQQVLSLLYGRPDRSFYTNEILRLTGMGVATIKRELDRMVDAGILGQTRIGNQRHYQANPNCPIYEELLGIIKKSFGVVDVLRQALAPLKQDVIFAFVYGSIAKGSEHAGSDIDVMLVGEGIVYTDTMEALLEAEQLLGRKINPTIYSPQEFESKMHKKQNFLSQVLGQKQLWLYGENDFKQRFTEEHQFIEEHKE